MAASGHFVKKMRSKVNFGHPKWAPAAILYKVLKKKFRMHTILVIHVDLYKIAILHHGM